MNRIVKALFFGKKVKISIFVLLSVVFSSLYSMDLPGDEFDMRSLSVSPTGDLGLGEDWWSKLPSFDDEEGVFFSHVHRLAVKRGLTPDEVETALEIDKGAAQDDYEATLRLITERPGLKRGEATTPAQREKLAKKYAPRLNDARRKRLALKLYQDKRKAERVAAELAELKEATLTSIEEVDAFIGLIRSAIENLRLEEGSLSVPSREMYKELSKPYRLYIQELEEFARLVEKNKAKIVAAVSKPREELPLGARISGPAIPPMIAAHSAPIQGEIIKKGGLVSAFVKVLGAAAVGAFIGFMGCELLFEHAPRFMASQATADGVFGASSFVAATGVFAFTKKKPAAEESEGRLEVTTRTGASKRSSVSPEEDSLLMGASEDSHVDAEGKEPQLKRRKERKEKIA